MYESLPGYDAWKTNAPEWIPGRCPECGTSQEDSECPLGGDVYTCFGCGHEYTDDEARYD